MVLETERILRPNLGTSADVPDVPSRTSMGTDRWKLKMIGWVRVGEDGDDWMGEDRWKLKP